MKKIAVKSVKAVKPIMPKMAAKKVVSEKSTDALEAPHKLKPHTYRYK
jgi:hypothetical protein